jgi:hypothetical protein
MKRNFYRGLLLLVGFPLVFGACKKDDDPAPDPIVATWKRDVYELKDVPANFSNFEGQLFYSYYGEDNLTLTIKNDKTYSRQFEVTGPDVSETGKWTLEGKAFNIKSDDSDFGEEDFTLETELTASSISMVLSKPETFYLVPNAISGPYFDANQNIPSDTVAKYRQLVDVTVLFSFDKVTTP